MSALESSQTPALRVKLLSGALEAFPIELFDQITSESTKAEYAKIVRLNRALYNTYLPILYHTIRINSSNAERMLSRSKKIYLGDHEGAYALFKAADRHLIRRSPSSLGERCLFPSLDHLHYSRDLASRILYEFGINQTVRELDDFITYTPYDGRMRVISLPKTSLTPKSVTFEIRLGDLRINRGSEQQAFITLLNRLDKEALREINFEIDFTRYREIDKRLLPDIPMNICVQAKRRFSFFIVYTYNTGDTYIREASNAITNHALRILSQRVTTTPVKTTSATSDPEVVYQVYRSEAAREAIDNLTLGDFPEGTCTKEQLDEAKKMILLEEWAKKRVCGCGSKFAPRRD